MLLLSLTTQGLK
uniref:Uncharacterized protein n=2 Tax=Moniliophthora roreri TaxID=221103 RepID=A0A0W0F6H6_MONRR